MVEFDANLPETAEELICFAVYSAGHAFNRAYQPLLSELGLTYPQYIALTLLWEEDNLTVGQICERLKLESSTVTPMLKRLEKMGHLIRNRSSDDERRVLVALTPSGKALKSHSKDMTRCIVAATGMDSNTIQSMVASLTTMRKNLREKNTK